MNTAAAGAATIAHSSVTQGADANKVKGAPEKMRDYVLLDDAGILLPDGRHAGAIYRMHPLELSIEETATDGSDLGRDFMEAYAAGSFHMLNPAGAMLLQSKALQAFIWRLRDNEELFSPEERETIYNHVLPISLREEEFAGKEIIV